MIVCEDGGQGFPPTPPQFTVVPIHGRNDVMVPQVHAPPLFTVSSTATPKLLEPQAKLIIHVFEPSTIVAAVAVLNALAISITLVGFVHV